MNRTLSYPCMPARKGPVQTHMYLLKQSVYVYLQIFGFQRFLSLSADLSQKMGIEKE